MSPRDHRKVAARSAGPGPAGWGSLGWTMVLDPDPDLPQSGGRGRGQGQSGGLPDSLGLLGSLPAPRMTMGPVWQLDLTAEGRRRVEPRLEP